jgi:hypothetical protein
MHMLDIDHQPSASEQRWFGVALALSLTIIGRLLTRVLGRPVLQEVMLTLGIVLGLVYYLVPRTRMPVYRAARLVQMPMAFVVWYTVLAILFYLVITPIALVMRLLGRDPLTRRLEPSRPSYWEIHIAPPDTESYFRMY